MGLGAEKEQMTLSLSSVRPQSSENCLFTACDTMHHSDMFASKQEGNQSLEPERPWCHQNCFCPISTQRQGQGGMDQAAGEGVMEHLLHRPRQLAMKWPFKFREG